jgi:hypothetical protein
MLTLANQPNSMDHNSCGFGYGEVYGMTHLRQHKPTSIAIQFYINVGPDHTIEVLRMLHCGKRESTIVGM